MGGMWLSEDLLLLDTYKVYESHICSVCVISLSCVGFLLQAIDIQLLSGTPKLPKMYD